MFSCPRCGSDELNEEIEGDPHRRLCTGCNNCWKPEGTPRLLDLPPPTEERRKDLA